MLKVKKKKKKKKKKICVRKICGIVPHLNPINVATHFEIFDVILPKITWPQCPSITARVKRVGESINFELSVTQVNLVINALCI